MSIMKEYLKEIYARCKKWIVGWWNLTPHFVVGNPNDPYMLRWYIIPRNDLCCIYLHKFLKSDDDRAMHDHPWWSISFLLSGSYIEHNARGKKEYTPGSIIVRNAIDPHRVELHDTKPCWTLFITGRRIREWGFHCPQGWVGWKDFTKPGFPGQPGKGCDQ